MADRLSDHGQALSLKEVAAYHEDAVSSFRFYFSDVHTLERFLGYTHAERLDELQLRIHETALRSILITLASLEASFRLDYEHRCRKRLKDDLSRKFRDIYKLKQQRAALDEDILEAWKLHIAESKELIGELRGAFKLRHWLAHGRYWQPKLGRTFDFDSVYDLAIAVVEEFFGTDS